MTVIPLTKNETLSKDALETLASGRRVLATEASGLQALADALGASFAQAVDMILTAEGRVILAGMGKSGHVGKKIAATMASTGTPAFFVHPAEASHGDMGMIQRGDVVIALSNSGESKELLDLIEYTRRYAIPLIGITSKADSTLATKSDIALLLPNVPEACPNGLAPTTSTTLTMALGDALAIALLEKKGFTAKDFSVFHPGGKLGQQLMRVTDIMHQGDKLPVAPENIPVAEAARLISDKGFGCLALVDAQGVLSGIVTDGDIRRHLSADLLTKTAREIMTRHPKTAGTDALVAEAVALMNDVRNQSRKITALIIVDAAGKPAGLLHIHDCLRAGFA